MTKYHEHLKKYTKKQLVEIVRKYNLEEAIQRYSVLKKGDLIDKIVVHSSKIFDEDPLRLKETLQPKISLSERRKIISRIMKSDKKYLEFSRFFKKKDTDSRRKLNKYTDEHLIKIKDRLPKIIKTIESRRREKEKALKEIYDKLIKIRNDYRKDPDSIIDEQDYLHKLRGDIHKGGSLLKRRYYTNRFKSLKKKVVAGVIKLYNLMKEQRRSHY